MKDVPIFVVVASMLGDGKVSVDCIGRVLVDGPRAHMLAYTAMPVNAIYGLNIPSML